jgi:hypothetical protein
MKPFNNTMLAALLGLTITLSGCTESRNGADGKARVNDDGAIEIQAPGIDVKINTEGVKVDVDTDGDGNTRSN